ncbi:Leucine carboxyl methyltransferase 2 [Wickerhamomyces ciferrii]|uniref:tRNA wybutosine-synthesizing protein 4 n=1 Tax=Wickerhamomyces ciferrii (strain ATCC 14091 / BCRC 22168 / CBS 111 / JCM 3599 / NBRC 0793 / NRRL Y-1031 F-60-10) TaxID=1206466 RepID=K0KR38_WICCF|nr:Leucine carboxyl methyltransferase 2 [Wickerhamomyces ciferrii]CCH45606.1 Leucine carboxyl methyltransferase 2 [Wickerhamomyces ciferrii]
MGIKYKVFQWVLNQILEITLVYSKKYQVGRMSEVINPPKVELTEKQRRKLEKDERRKKFADTTIQGTNDYSIVSKRSVEKLYTQKLDQDFGISTPEYFKHFVKKVPRRSPAINRGYWTRMEAIKQSTLKIIQNSLNQGKKITIINLGAGYDPLAFQFLDSRNPDNSTHEGKVSFIDVDYPDLNKMKVQMINNSSEIKDIIGKETESKSSIEGVELQTSNYTVLSCDLKNIELFLKQLNALNLNDDQITKIYIAEVSIAYMAPEFADKVISATSNLPDSHFLCLEQILPAGQYQGFARTMLFHFNKLNSPLKSVETYPTITKQIERFEKSGYTSVGAIDLMGFWRSLPKSLHKQIDQVEAFDELEEFIHFCQHYLILHASNSSKSLYDKEPELIPIKQDSNFNKNFKLIPKNQDLERKFPAVTVSPDHNEILLNGGASISRLNSTLIASKKDNTPIFNNPTIIPSPRMTHTLNTLNNNNNEGKYLLVGGRHAPGKELSDSWILEQKNDNQYEWKEIESLPSSRSRHSTFQTNNETYIYGGNFESEPFIRFNGTNWETITTQGSITSKKSSALAFNGSKGIIIGGLNSEGGITNTLHTFTIDQDNNTIKTELLFEHPLLSRYSAKAQFISEDEILLFGGVSDYILYDQFNTIIKINLKNLEITSIKIPDEIWENFPMLVGFELIKFQNSLICIGGGEVCYSFGSIWNDILIIGDDEIPDFKLQQNSI